MKQGTISSRARLAWPLHSQPSGRGVYTYFNAYQIIVYKIPYRRAPLGRVRRASKGILHTNQIKATLNINPRKLILIIHVNDSATVLVYCIKYKI